MKNRIVWTVSCMMLAVALVACGRGNSSEPPLADTTTKVVLAKGTYKVSFGQGYAAADEQKLLAITAALDRTGQQLVFTMQDGTKKALNFAPRDQSQWMLDCYTMRSHYLDEVADLTPAPLQLESMTFNAPLVYAKCSQYRMILSDTLRETSGKPALILDFQY